MAADVPWISVGELAHAFSPEAYAPHSTSALAGRTIRLHLETGAVREYRFESETELTWAVLPAGATGLGGSTGSKEDAPAETAAESYFAIEVRAGFFFVDHVCSSERATSVSLLLDFEAGSATVVTGRLPDEARSRLPLEERIARGEELTAVDVELTAAAIDASFTSQTLRHEPTSDLVGKRVEYTYSPTEQYEHIYLNDRFYTWHCLRGVEKGLADTDRCHYLSLAEDLYLFVWREKIVPTLGVVVVDFQQLRTAGKIFGYRDDDAQGLADFPVGAKARVLNVTERDGGI